jgi:Lipase (class 3)
VPTLFSSLTSLEDLRAAAILTEFLCNDDYPRVSELLLSIENGVDRVPLASIKPDVAVFLSNSYIIVICSGTENVLQQLDNFAGPIPIHTDPFPGATKFTWAQQANQVIASVGEEVVPLLPTRTLALMGHSRGGAVATLLASVWGPMAARCFCYTFGAPRSGDTAFAAVAAPFVVNIQNETDPITILPPHGEELPSLVLRYLGVTQAVTVRYADTGAIKTLFGDGRLVDGREGDKAFWSQVTDGAFPTHAMSVYRERLTLNAPDPFTPTQVTAPAVWNTDADVLATQTPPLQPPTPPAGMESFMPSPLVGGSFFFKSLDRTFGWTETWYATISVSSMIDALRNLTTYRLAFLSPDCVIYWYRGSVVEIGQARQSATFKRSSPAKGTARPGGTVAADYPGSTMDCIVATLVSSQGSRRQEKFRGLPDAYIEDDSLSTTGTGALDIINSYLLQVKAAGLGIRRQTMAPDAKLAITAMDQAANGNIQLTVPAHGILESQPFRALIRGRDLANPMLRGTWNLRVIDANTLECISSTRFGKGSGVAGGTVTVASYGADSLVNPPAQTRLFDFNQTSTIKTGRPSDLHHGKRSPVVRHR